MKIKLILTGEEQSKPLLYSPNYTSALENKDIQFVKTGEDATLVHASLLTKEMLLKGDPLIILERIDAAVVVKKAELKKQNVIGMIKNTCLNPWELNNHPCCYGRYHTTLIGGDVTPGLDVVYSESTLTDPNAIDSSPYRRIQIDPNVILTKEDAGKIHCGFSFCHYAKMNGLDTLPVLFDTDRKNDIHFVGTIEYGNNVLITKHRNRAVEQIKKLKGASSICFGGRPQTAKNYIISLLNTKIALSPWGHGEACYRDFEAMFCGCVLLKPDSSFVKSWPDIYQNGITYIPCNADFSDLQEKVDWIKGNWSKLADMRKSNLELVIRARRPKEFADHMSGIFHDCLK